MAFYISGPKLLFETTEISTRPISTQQESNYIYLYTTKFGTSIKIRLTQKFESTEFETMRVNCIVTFCPTYIRYMNQGIYIYCDLLFYTVVKELRPIMFGQHPGYFKAVFLKQTRIIIVSIYKYTVYIIF